MPAISRDIISETSSLIKVAVSNSDYAPKVKQKLRELQAQSNIKGFRPGQTPMSFIRKRFGNSIVAEIVEDMVKEAMGNYFKEEKLVYLAQPLPAMSNNYRYDVETNGDYNFEFELGTVPSFELKGATLENVLPFYDIIIDEEFLETEIDKLRKRFSTGFEDNIIEVQDEDMVFCRLDETENGQIKHKGLSRAEIPFFLRDINPTLKEQLIGSEVGVSVDVNVYEIEPKRDREFVRKHFLQTNSKHAVNDTFKLTVERIQRPKKAEMSNDFFNRLFPNEGSMDADTFQEKMRGELQKAYKQLSMQKFFGTIYDSLMELNPIVLPIEFLEKWLTLTNENKLPEDFFSSEQFKAMQNDIRWGLLRDRTAAQLGLEVSREDVEDSVRVEILRYFNYQIPPYGEYINGMINRLLSDRQEFQKRYEAVLDERVLERLSEEIGKDVKPVSKADFDAMNPAAATEVLAAQ
jgi:trigger factor